MLVSPGLLPHLGPAEILSLPPKWSDHAAVALTLQDISGPEPHPPCAQSSHKDPRFSQRSQPSVAAMFARSQPRCAAWPLG